MRCYILFKLHYATFEHYSPKADRLLACSISAEFCGEEGKGKRGEGKGEKNNGEDGKEGKMKGSKGKGRVEGRIGEWYKGKGREEEGKGRNFVQL